MAAQQSQQQQQVVTASAAKRHKVSRPSVVDATECFPGVSRIEYRPDAGPEESLVYRFYNATERIHGRTMEDWIRPALTITTLRGYGLDDCPHQRSTGTNGTGANPDKIPHCVDGYKRRIRAAFELCTKLGLKLWAAWDSDLYAESQGSGEAEKQRNLEEAVDIIAELQTRTGVRPLYYAADLHSSARFRQGAGTAAEATSVTAAGAALNRALAVAQRLGSECFLFWGGRESYSSPLNTDANRDIRTYGRVLRMIADQRDRLGFRGQLLFEAPRRCNSDSRRCQLNNDDVDGERCTCYRYDVGAAGALCLLKHHGLERHYRLCVTAPPIHDAFVSSGYGALGAVRATSPIPPDPRETTLLMKTILEQGGLQPGGIIIRPNLRRNRGTLRDLVAAHVAIIDAYGRALRVAGRIIADGIFSRNVQNRYLSFHTGFGSRLSSGDATLEDCEEQAHILYQQQQQQQQQQTQLQPQSAVDWGVPGPCRSDHWETVCARYIEQERGGGGRA